MRPPSIRSFPNLVYTRDTRNRWTVIAACLHRAHARAIFKDCLHRWHDRRFKLVCQGWPTLTANHRRGRGMRKTLTLIKRWGL